MCRYRCESLFFDIADPGAPDPAVRRFRVLPLVTCEGVKGDNRFILLLSTAAFLVCTAAAGAGLLRPLDVLIVDQARRTDSGILDGVGLVTSVVGGVEFVAVATVALAAGLLLDGRGHLALRLVFAFLVTGLIEIAAKTVVPQPPVPEEAMRAPDPSLLDVSTPYPYPSGHMLRSVLRPLVRPRRVRHVQGLPRNTLALGRHRRGPARHRRTRMDIRKASQPRKPSTYRN